VNSGVTRILVEEEQGHGRGYVFCDVVRVFFFLGGGSHYPFSMRTMPTA